jgi:hypothetical protein
MAHRREINAVPADLERLLTSGARALHFGRNRLAAYYLQAALDAAEYRDSLAARINALLLLAELARRNGDRRTAVRFYRHVLAESLRADFLLGAAGAVQHLAAIAAETSPQQARWLYACAHQLFTALHEEELRRMTARNLTLHAVVTSAA